MTKLPTNRPSRVVIEMVSPLIDGGRFAAKAALGEPVTVVADVFGDGHDAVNAALRWRSVAPKGRGGKWTELAMQFDGNDRWHATFVPTKLGPHEFEVTGWSDHPETWRHGTERKIDADVDVAVELMAGETIVSGLLERARADQPDGTTDVGRLEAWLAELADGGTTMLHDDWGDVFWRHAVREPLAASGPLSLEVDPERARFSAWYEFFPRSTIAPATGHATLRDAIDRLDYVAAMGFDVLYLPPIHPIGVVNRKGANNTTTAGPDDVGSPWGIADHLAVHPDLGTIDDVHALGNICRQRGIELALDIAFQCTPDHPWVTEHPEWFAHRADGTIQYAENPPKKYQDIYPIDFESSDWEALWQGLADVIRFWIDQGVTIFRVDNPHTKAVRVLGVGDRFDPPRPPRHDLPGRSIHPATHHGTARQDRLQPVVHLLHLAARGLRAAPVLHRSRHPHGRFVPTERVAQYARHPQRPTPTRWPSDVREPHDPGRHVVGQLGHLRTGVRAARTPRHQAGLEEYLDSEKYQLRTWQLDDPDSIAPLITRLNEIRRSQPALQHLRHAELPRHRLAGLLCYSKTDPLGVGDPVLVVVNVDTYHRHAGYVHIDPATFGLDLGDNDEFEVDDLLGGGIYRWRGWHNYVDLTPGRGPAHVFAVRRIDASAPESTTEHTA